MPKKIYHRNVILAEAINMAKELGLEGLSMRKLAKALKCSVTPVYDAYESKEDLIKAVYKKVVEETHASEMYFERNENVLLFGIRSPLLYRDIRRYADVLKDFNTAYNDIIELMKSEPRLKGFTRPMLESLNFDLMIYMNGLVEKSMVSVLEASDIEKQYLMILRQVTELFILGYKHSGEGK